MARPRIGHAMLAVARSMSEQAWLSSEELYLRSNVPRGNVGSVADALATRGWAVRSSPLTAGPGPRRRWKLTRAGRQMLLREAREERRRLPRSAEASEQLQLELA